jgi:hypothetical protein
MVEQKDQILELPHNVQQFQQELKELERNFQLNLQHTYLQILQRYFYAAFLTMLTTQDVQ